MVYRNQTGVVFVLRQSNENGCEEILRRVQSAALLSLPYKGKDVGATEQALPLRIIIFRDGTTDDGQAAGKRSDLFQRWSALAESKVKRLVLLFYS